MVENPYERFQREELILRDELAIDRTILANERTVLAYFRSALTLVIVGITFLQFFEKGILPYVGIVFIPCGLAVGVFGFMRYRKMDTSIRIIRRSLSRNTEDNNRSNNRVEAIR
jgi:putative membrane protein